MAGELWPWLLSVASGVGASCLTWRLTTKSVREAEVRVLRREAAVELSVPLRQLQTLIRRHGRTNPPPSPGEVASAFLAWTTAFDQFGHRLPDRWQHVGRSVRAASGTVFGPVTFADIRPETVGEALEAPNFVWQDFGDDYIDYLLRVFLPWGDSLIDGGRQGGLSGTSTCGFGRRADGMRPAAATSSATRGTYGFWGCDPPSFSPLAPRPSPRALRGGLTHLLTPERE
jgi:hypothetical protein